MNVKKILFIAPRNPYSKGFSGDKIRAVNIISHLNKKIKVDVIYNDNKTIKKNSKNHIVFRKSNIFKTYLYFYIFN